MRSLKAAGSPLADVQEQLHILDSGEMIPFQQKLEHIGMMPLKATGMEIFQVNIGRMCNQTCRHCHVDAGPDRKEMMTETHMRRCLEILEAYPEFGVVDITGGAPELHPRFRWFAEQVARLNRHIIVRCNLTIIVSNKRFHDLPDFYRAYGMEVVSSLPFYAKDRTDRQRGDGVFEDSLQALRMLNEAGYGKEGTGLRLNLVYNPAGAFLPPEQAALERDYKQVLLQQFGIEFNQLYVITNMPINRYLDYLLTSGNYEHYMSKLVQAFNASAAAGVMCRNTVSIGWNGYLYDCDFNQMLDLKIGGSTANHIDHFDADTLRHRDIMIGQHCYGCTAGAGSSCGGAIS